MYVLYCIVLYCILWYCIVLYLYCKGNILYHILLCIIISSYAILHCVVNMYNILILVIKIKITTKINKL